MKKVFIDGSAGTTGLRIYERLSRRQDISTVILPEEERKNTESRRKALNSADIAFLCLPDAASVEAVSLIENDSTVVIDTSTAHRTSDGWAYGFPEIGNFREKIRTSKRIANPGCHASGFVSLVAPLTESGLLRKDACLTCFSLTGYSGGGKKMIADYENPENAEKLLAPRQYGISQKHKHLPEMVKICGLENAPVFCPVVSSYYAGMEVTVPVFAKDLNGNADDVRALYREYFRNGLVRYCETGDENGFVSAAEFEGRDDMRVFVTGNEERIILVSQFDNLGKGASGAAIQNMNIVLGAAETTGLVTEEDI